MKRNYYQTVIVCLYALVPSCCTIAQTTSENFVKSETFINGNGGKVTTVQYYDGMGRPTLNATNSLGNGGKYVYTRQQYDYCGRVSEQSIAAYGSTSPEYSTSLNWIYNDTHRSTTFTYDVLDRITIEKGPGDPWHTNSRFNRVSYLLNNANEVKLYMISGNTLSQSDYYGEGKLFVEQYTDEDNHVSRVYKDMQGRTVMERRDGNHDTYYVYDYRGDLRYVLPPKASGYLTGSTWNMNSFYIKRYCYYYEYDGRARCTKKRLPGCDYVTMTYDTNNRLVKMQDGNMCEDIISTYYQYDNVGRQTVMGTKTSSGVKTPLLETFYDDYSFLTSTESSKVGFNSTNGYESSYASAKGLQTGSRVHHLNDPSSYEVTAMYYNEYGEMIQRRSTNIRSGNDDDYILYNHFTGKKLNHKHIHSSYAQTPHTEIYTYTYDTSDQLTSVKHKFDDNAQVTLYSLEYDNIGRVSSKALMNNAETVSYCYNIRDWMTGLSSTNFSENLYYHNSPSPYFNGNISRLTWSLTSSSTTRGYDFVYDNLNRLTSATYGESESLQTNRNRYSTSYTYDKNGNILTLTRKGLQDGGSYGLIDNLTFIYAGNQVTRIDDSVNDPTYNGAFNFVDGASQSNEYTYDPNGNMTKDLNKNILSIQYNLLNLPQCMRLGNGNSAEYAYNAAGERLSTTYGDLTSGVTFYHSANYFYTYGPLYIFIDGGYITLSGSTPVYHYYLKDHLGSNRVVCNASGAVEQVNHYYPFGGLFGESTNASTQKYKYNGKELERVHGLDWYDYGARFMNPDIGRFTTIDPMAEKYYSVSPYAYCANNPINAIDVDGNDIFIQYKNKDGRFQTFRFSGFGGKSIRIPKNQFVKDVIAAYLYNASDGNMNNMIEAVTNSKYKIFVRDATDPDVMDKPSSRTFAHEGKQIITWESRKGLKTTEGGRQSAATILEHEFDHAVDNLKNGSAHRLRSYTYNEQYDNEEEKRVIEGSEARTALSHGEAVRKNHKGETFETINPLSIIENKKR